MSYLRQQQLLDNALHGFLSGQYCRINPLIAMNRFNKAMNEVSDVNLCLSEINKTFHAVNHRMICAKLIALGISDHLVTWIMNFLTANPFQVRFGNALSNEVSASSGVPQDLVIDLHLFLVMIIDLSGERQLFCSMLANVTKMEAKPLMLRSYNLACSKSQLLNFAQPYPPSHSQIRSVLMFHSPGYGDK